MIFIDFRDFYYKIQYLFKTLLILSNLCLSLHKISNEIIILEDSYNFPLVSKVLYSY